MLRTSVQLPVTSDRGVGGVTPLGRGDRRQISGGSLVSDVTGRLQSFVLLPGAVSTVHLPAVPVGVRTVDVVILLILDPAVDGILLLGDEPVRDEHGGEGVWCEVEPVHVLILHQSVAHLAALEPEAAQEVLLVVQGQAGGLQHYPGALVEAGRALEHLAVSGPIVVHAVAVLVGVNQVPGAHHVVLGVVTVGAQGAVDVSPAILEYLMTPLPELLTRRVDTAIILVLTRDDLHNHSRGRGTKYQKYKQKHEMLQHDGESKDA